jgi:cytochrome oxidase Cu insertion factor (SCO1/SenC/PrrC family)
VAATDPSVARGKPFPSRLGWALWALALLVGIVAGVLLFILDNARHAAPLTIAPPGPTKPAAVWPAGQLRAPNFRLADQNGRRVSVAAYRGRPLLVTFIDPLCRNFCPLEAKVLNDVVDRLPAARRPEIIAVSVNIYGNARRYLLDDVQKWHLVPQWRWAVGRPAQLATVWKRYKIGVQATTKTIAGIKVHNISHTEAVYLVDPAGYQRALFLWPFQDQDVEATLRELSAS